MCDTTVNCLNKRSCGLRPSNVLHFPSYFEAVKKISET